MKIALILLVLLCADSCAYTSVPHSNLTQCSFYPEGEEVFADCADGSHFQGPIRGGAAYGFDRRGHDLPAYISFQDGHYSILMR